MLILDILLDNQGVISVSGRRKTHVCLSLSGHWDMLFSLTSMEEACQMFCLWSRRWHFAQRATSKGTEMLVFFFFFPFSKKKKWLEHKKKAEFSTGDRTLTNKWCLEKQRILLENYVSQGLAKWNCVSGSESGSADLFKQSRAGSGRKSREIPSEINSTAYLQLSTISFPFRVYFISMYVRNYWMLSNRHIHHLRQTNKYISFSISHCSDP